MPAIFAASESRVLIEGEPVEGVQSVDYRLTRQRDHVYAVGTTERVGVTPGRTLVEGRIRVASVSAGFENIPPDEPFQMVLELRRGDSGRRVAFDECYMSEKNFAMEVAARGEAEYAFTATRVREEDI